MKRKEKQQRATETEWERRSQLNLTKLAEFINFFSGNGKLTSLMRCLS